MSDYYNVLRIGHNATRKDIEQAYHRLLKEAKYDTTIDRSAVETAYKILSDIASKAQYDAKQTIRLKRQDRSQKKERKKNILDTILAWFTLRNLIYALVICFVATGLFYWFRFGYKLKDFKPGDIVYDKVTNRRYGKILRVEDNHLFGTDTEKAYQIELDKTQMLIGVKEKKVWLPQDSVKSRCYKP